jgi:MerR family transcriptional regulator, light-induced transcriptional regulator
MERALTGHFAPHQFDEATFTCGHKIGAPGTPRARPSGALSSSLESILIPALMDAPGLRTMRHRVPGTPTADVSTLPARELAKQLARADVTDGLARIDELCPRSVTVLRDCIILFEATAAELGDLWRRDECDEFDVALGMFHLQAALRRLCADLQPRTFKLGPAVLIIPEPGETHTLTAALDSESLWHAGWKVHFAFPRNDADVMSLVEQNWFDAVDVSLSDAFTRDHWLPRVTSTIGCIRQNSLNKDVAVVTGGRLFRDMDEDCATRSGADAICASAMVVEQVITRAIRDR